MIDPLDTALSTTAMAACCIHTVRTALHHIAIVDDGDTIHCNACPAILELHGRVWLNQQFAPNRTGLA